MDGIETVEAPLPALVTVSNELGEPRYPQLRQIMAAARKEVSVWSAADLGPGRLEGGRRRLALNVERLYVPVRESQVRVRRGRDAGGIGSEAGPEAAGSQAHLGRRQEKRHG